jgi:POT family proton-dependent oligopeptide transporter
MMVGIYSVSTFIGGTVSGRLGGLYERMTPAEFWLLHAAMVVTGGVAFFVCSGWLRRELKVR